MKESSRSIPQILTSVGKAALYLLLFLGSQLLVSTVYSVAAALYVIWTAGEMDFLLVVQYVYDSASLITLISNGLTIGALLLFFAIRHKPLGDSLWMKRCSGSIVGFAAAAAFGLYLLVSMLLALLPESWLMDYAAASSALNQTGVAPFLATVIAAPVAEEMVFRGLIQTRLNRVLPGWAAVLIAAVVFGICHGQLVWFCYACLLGIVFGWMTLKSGSIFPSLAAHMVFNAIGYLSVALTQLGIGDLAVLLILAAVCVVGCLIFRRGLSQLTVPKACDVGVETSSDDP